MSFFGQSEVVPIRTQQVPQTIETQVTFVPIPNAYVRYAYSRSSDSMANQIEGQDYMCFRHNDQRMAFVVADGVGSSFCGNLAARILGDNLLDWIWSLDIAYLGGAPALQEAATSYLNKLQKQAYHEVEEYEIPDQIPGLIRQALEQQRAYGSEAIFAAGRIDYPNPMMMPEGLFSGFWMGDTTLRVIDNDGKQIDLGGNWENGNRWSTVKGTRGKMFAWMGTLNSISRVSAFTDGLSAHSVKLLDYSDDKLDREIHAGARLPTSDDVAFIDIVSRSAQYDGHPDPALPDPNAERPSLEQIWNPTNNDSFELRWNWPGHPKARFIIQQATNPALTESTVIDVEQGALSWKPSLRQKPGHYYYRVRAITRRGKITPWSELRLTRVAHPPPPAPTLNLDESSSPVLHWSDEGETLDYKLERSSDPNFAEIDVVYEGRGNSWNIPFNTITPGAYHYRVCAISDGGNGEWSSVQQVDITIPPPPVPHLASVNYGGARGHFELRWQPVPGAKHYELESLERKTEAIESDKTEDSIYQVHDLSPGDYVYRVRACHNFGCSEWSNEQLVIVAPERPSEAPTLTITGPDENNRLLLEWTEVEHAAQYRVEVADDIGFDDARILNLEGRQLELPRHEPGVQVFRVQASNAGGHGPWSAIEKVVIQPDAPARIETELSSDGQKAKLAWGTVGGMVTYQVEMIGEGGIPEEVYQGADTHTIADLPTNIEEVTFRVRAELPGVESDWKEGEKLVLHRAPATPIMEDAEVLEKSGVELRWTEIEGSTHYVIEAAGDEDFDNILSAFPVEKLSVKFHPPGSGRYWFRVKACTRNRQSVPSNTVTAVVERPAPPRLWPVEPIGANTPYEITWKGMPGCAYYEVQESETEDFAPAATQTARVDHPGQKLEREGRGRGKVFYRIKVVDERSQSSHWSDVLTVSIKN